MAVLNPYLNFNGNTEEAFNFYKSVFGGEYTALMRFKEVPPEFQQNKDEAEKIMHVALPIGKGTILMGSDIPASMKQANFGNNLQIAISTESEDEANRIFNGLSSDGKVSMPMDKTFWGAYFGMLTDKYGVHWMVSYDLNGQN
ncbi:MAG: VOC family protein [Ignavibacteriae bacterium]|nr:MAG: VOC family protein [Ignavibacteriota bacterium]